MAAVDRRDYERQCTDARVNMVTADLFRKYDTLEKFANADLKELEQDIHSTGFYHMKAKNIIACCRDLVDKHGSEVPRTIEELTALAGVGRKTANVIRGNIYNEPSIVVDTHVKRISRKLGLTKSEDPVKIEQDLMKRCQGITGFSGISTLLPWAAASASPPSQVWGVLPAGVLSGAGG